ncbi:hypothetical protein L6164_026446 [Bauhinia variegata]|uniref:Uncharacterized protein n=1 Tax=Bauhinia variegata TaxID=167791 RepID=A0ACB9LPY3_BAUVA|nr:hypothetical protein L6164_026446 [Bauhinia variegata]
MAAPVPRGASRPGNNPPPPPNYNPNIRGTPDSLANNMQNLNLNRPPMVSNSVARPPPFGQAQPFQYSVPSQGFPSGAIPFSRPGAPPGAQVRPAVPPSGPPSSAFPQNVASVRPSGPPPTSQPLPYGSRPPPTSLPSSMAGPVAPVSGVPHPGSSPPTRLVSPPQPPAMGAPRLSTYTAPPMGASQVMPPSGVPVNLMSNGPPAFSSGALPGPPRFPPVGTAQQPPVGPPLMRAPPGSAIQSQLPSSLSPPSMMPPPIAPYSTSSWPMQQQQGTPSGPVPGHPPAPGMFGMPPPPMLNQSMTTTIPPVGQAGAPIAGPSKIDPNQIPRPSPSTSVIFHETRQGNQATIPPPAMSDYIVRDTGNCSPRYMRCTIDQIPFTADLLGTSGMQLALLVQPLALPHPSEEPIQVVDFGESGPVRCSRCKAYVNPFMKFIDQGWRFICNLCGFTDETPRDYHCNLGPDGRRRDADERPELCRGTVEFVATKEFMVREPMPAVYFFLIDVSMNAVQTGATAAACSAISQVIADLPEGPRTMVGVATFDSTIHFYNLKRALQQPLMLIVPDVQDVYTPLVTDVIVPLSECRQHLELLLESIPTMFQNNRTSESAFGAAIKAAFLAMKGTGGKLLVFQSVLPSIGIGALSAREAEGRTNISAGEKEAHKLLQPADKTFKTLAIEFAEYQVCVDLFITSQTYVDIASISDIPRTTGGQVYYYYPFSALSDPAKLYNDLRWNITRPQGFEAVMRVRCSQGIQVQEYHGNFCKRVPTDVDLAGIDCDKTFMVTLKHDDKLQDGSECAFQCALLYTTLYGQRRIRVITLSLPVTSMLSNLFRAADLDAQFCCFLKQAAIEIPSRPLPLVREQVTNLCINALFAYRKFCATVSSSGQLILPEALKLLPLYTLALTRSTGLRTEGNIDERSFWINYVSSLSTHLAIPLVYPRLLPIHDLDTKEDEESVIPPFLPLSSEHINTDGIYLLENGHDCLIYIGESVNPDIVRRLFGVATADEIPTLFVLQQYDNPLSKKLNEVVNEIRRQRCSYLRLKLCKKGDPSGMAFFSYMVEDKGVSGLSYVEFLIHVHRQIQSKMAQ